MATNTSSPQQEANFLDEEDDTGSDKEADNANVPESKGKDTGVYYGSSLEHNFQPQDELEGRGRRTTNGRKARHSQSRYCGVYTR